MANRWESTGRTLMECFYMTRQFTCPCSSSCRVIALLATIPVRSATHPGEQDRPAYAETQYPHRAFGWSSLRALREGKYLYVRAPQAELYDQGTDPKAEHNLANTSKAVSETLAAQLEDFRSKTS